LPCYNNAMAILPEMAIFAASLKNNY